VRKEEIKLSNKEQLQVIFSLLKNEVAWKKLLILAVIIFISCYCFSLTLAPRALAILLGFLLAVAIYAFGFIIADILRDIYTGSIKPKYDMYKEMKQEELLKEVDKNFVSETK
jgi:hypothetical protein